SGTSLSGADAGNYTFNTSTTTTANITARVPAGSTTTVTVSNATYDGSAHGGSASWVSDGADAEGAELTVSYVGVNVTVYASSVAPTDAGDYRASASFASDANHTGSSASAAFTIAKANALISVNGYGGTYDGQAHGLTGSAAGVNSESLSGLLNLGATQVNAGHYVVSWAFAGNGNYNSEAGTSSI